MEPKIIIPFILIVLNFFIVLSHQKLITFFNIYDIPDKKRKFHKTRTSLFGGSIILINLIVFIFLDYIFQLQSITSLVFPYFILGCLFFYIFGLVDDKKDLNSNFKFAIEISIIFLLLLFDKNILIEKIYFYSLDFSIDLGRYSFLFTVLSITIFINALNMFDGINLQNGSYCLIIISSLFFYSQFDLFLACLIISLITFLYLNYKSKLFLGDNGTYLLGFLISYIIIYTAKVDNYIILSADKIFIIMLLPGLDLIRLFITRLIKKRHPFSPDTNHIHHILLKKFGFKKTIFFLALFTSVGNLMAHLFDNHLILIIITLILIYIISLYMNEK
tara:strand:+ start:915 stop:1910 length:996 start_codon:yes stop_codon:yes gene_type:complete